MLPYNKHLKEIAQSLRDHPTKEEWCLWQQIRRENLQYRFYRQKPIGKYIVDFFCPKARLVVEIDGSHHYTEVGKGNDKVRDEYMKSLGLSTIRFPNSEVLNHTERVVARIYKILFTSPFTKENELSGNSRRTFVAGASSPFVKGRAEKDSGGAAGGRRLEVS